MHVVDDPVNAATCEFAGPDPSILFHFDSVVVVGASEQLSRIGGATLHLLLKYGHQSPIYALNPKYEVVQGVPCFASPAELPGPVDVAIFCSSAATVRHLLPELQQKGLKGAVIFSAGFIESGPEGHELQLWLSRFARKHGIAILGPNCAGQISFANQRAMTFTSSLVAAPPMEAGHLALLSQSGGVATNILADCLASGTRFSHMITTGNEAVLKLADYLRFLANDPATHTVLGYLEGLSDGQDFCAGAREMQRAGKALIMMRVGVSSVGQDAASSHTGQLSCDDTGFEAAFERYGVIRVQTLQQLNDYARVFSLPHLKPGLTVVTTSGGAGVYVADLCESHGVAMSQLSAETERQLAAIVPSYGRVRNPIDLTAQVVNDMSILERSLRILLDDPATGTLLFLLSGKGTLEQSQEVIDLFKKLDGYGRKTLVVCWLGVDESVRIRGSSAGVHVFQDPARFIQPLRAYLEHHRPRTAAPLEAADVVCPPALELRHLLSPASGQAGKQQLSEPASMNLLSAYGVSCPAFWRVTTIDELRAIESKIPYPCVMKVVRPELAHKSDEGGVILGIHNATQLQESWHDLRDRLDVVEVLVAEQVTSGIEILVGCVRDPAFGMRLTIGSGGIWANFIQDAVTVIPPFTEEEIRRHLPRLKSWAPLSGARGQRPLAVDALVQTVLKIAEFGQATSAQLSEFECNPVIVTADRAVVVDAIGFA